MYEKYFDGMPRKPDPEMMPADVKRLKVYREHSFEQRFYFISESEMMIYRYYIPEEYHPRPSQRSWDIIHPGCENGYVKKVYHKTNSKSKVFEMIPDSSYTKRVRLTLNEKNWKQLKDQNKF